MSLIAVLRFYVKQMDTICVLFVAAHFAHYIHHLYTHFITTETVSRPIYLVTDSSQEKAPILVSKRVIKIPRLFTLLMFQWCRRLFDNYSLGSDVTQSL